MTKRDSIIEEYFAQKKSELQNQLLLSSSTLVCFSGVPASGKTTLSKVLSQKLPLPRIGVDDITKLIDPQRRINREERRNIILKHLTRFLSNLTQGSALVLDKGNDRDIFFFESLKRSFTGHIYVINLDVAKPVAYKRIMSRNNWLPNKFISNLDNWLNQHRIFKREHKNEILLSINTSYNFNEKVNKVCKIVENTLNALKV
ncbi:MAG: AAA family ATPase [Patescibacteria group bacterium]